MENDIDFYGTLTTEIIPKYAIIVAFIARENGVKILTKNGMLPILNIPTSSVTNAIFSGHGKRFYMVNLKFCFSSICEIIFDTVQDKHLNYFRPDFSEEFVVIEVEIESVHKLKDNCQFVMEEFPDIDVCYQKTMSNMFK
jgi:hypothetical protein